MCFSSVIKYTIIETNTIVYLKDVITFYFPV